MRLHRSPKRDSWVYLLPQIRGLAKNGAVLEKEFLSKELSGTKIELDEVVEPLIPLDGGAGQGKPLLPQHRLRRKLMMMIMKLRIKLLSDLAGRQDHVLLSSGTGILSYLSCS